MGRNFQFVIFAAVAGPTQLVAGEEKYPLLPSPSQWLQWVVEMHLLPSTDHVHLGRAATCKTP